MPDERKVLILGSSSAFHRANAAELNLPPLTHNALAKRDPQIEWQMAGESLFFAPHAADRTLTMVKRHHPDVVVLTVDGYRVLEALNTRKGSPEPVADGGAASTS